MPTKIVNGEEIEMTSAEMSEIAFLFASMAPAQLDFPPDISDRQFFQALALPPYQIITENEALAAVQTGALPAAFETLIANLPTPGERFAAKMLLSGATSYNRYHQLTETFGSMHGMASQDIDALWAMASEL